MPLKGVVKTGRQRTSQRAPQENLPQNAEKGSQDGLMVLGQAGGMVGRWSGWLVVGLAKGQVGWWWGWLGGRTPRSVPCAKSRPFSTISSHGTQGLELYTLQPLLVHQAFFF